MESPKVPLSYQTLNNITLIINDNVIKKVIAANEATGKKSEWIGILFYKKIDNTTLETVDICYMGKGPENSMVASIDYTEFPELSSVLSNYVMNNAETIMDCYQGLIHSHIDMGTSPSGTDLAELTSNNSNYNGTYLSVICNHKLEFTALVSIEQEQPKKINHYKWFGEVVTKEIESEKSISIYSIKTQFNNTEYPDIVQALDVVEKARAFKMKPSYQTAIWENGTSWKPKQTAWNNDSSWGSEVEERTSFLEDLDEYFEFSNKTNYVEKIQALNTYTKKGYSVDAFIKAVSPFNANTLLKDLKRFSHTNFYKDMKSYIDIFKLGYDEL
jgi:proteasome lid subunit RPN8/RPN11